MLDSLQDQCWSLVMKFLSNTKKPSVFDVVFLSVLMKMEVRTWSGRHSQTNIHCRSCRIIHTPPHPLRPPNQILPSLMSQIRWPCSLALASRPVVMNWLPPVPRQHRAHTTRPHKSEWIWNCLCWEDKMLSSSCRRNITRWNFRW